MRRIFISALLFVAMNTSAYGQGLIIFPYIVMQHKNNATCKPAFAECRDLLDYGSETMRIASESVVDFCRRTPRCLSHAETKDYEYYFNDTLVKMVQCVCVNGCRKFDISPADPDQPIPVINQTIDCSKNGW